MPFLIRCENQTNPSNHTTEQTRTRWQKIEEFLIFLQKAYLIKKYIAPIGKKQKLACNSKCKQASSN
jgi:hypothetical protein